MIASLVNSSRFLRFGALNCTKLLGTELSAKQTSLASIAAAGQNLWDQQIRSYRKIKGVPRRLPWAREYPEYQSEVINMTEEDERKTNEVCKEINKQVAEDRTGRLFAVIHVMGKQYKITESDLIVIRGYWPPNPGDKINFDKVLLVGSKDFTLLGRPVLNRQLISIDATVIDKTMSHMITHFKFRKRKQYRRINFQKYQQTMVRINTIKINGKVDQKLEVEGLDRIY